MTLLLACLVGCGEAPEQEASALATVSLILPHILAAPSATFDIACDNAYGTNVTGDWQMTNVTVSTSISILGNKTCRLTLKQYFDGTTTFTPLNINSPLVITVSNTGTITTTSTFSYTNGATPTPNLQWFIAAQNGASYTLAINYAPNAVSATQSISPTTLTPKTMTLDFGTIAAPLVTLITVTRTSIVVVRYTLTAAVVGATGCKYISNSGSPAPYNPSDWISVNTAYNHASAQACPVLIVGSPLLLTGNWTTQWQSGKTLVIWANTQNGVSAYTTSNIGP